MTEHLARMRFDSKESAQNFLDKLHIIGREPHMDSYPTGWVTVFWSTDDENADASAVNEIHFNVEAELKQYIATALWSSTHYESEQDDNPVPMDNVADADDIAEEARAAMRDELRNFMTPHEDGTEDWKITALNFWCEELGEGSIGHDFWLTRNGHGAGFWDRFSEGLAANYGRMLTEACKPYGTSDLYVGTGDKIYVN